MYSDASRGVAPGWNAPRRWRVIVAEFSNGENWYVAIYEIASSRFMRVILESRTFSKSGGTREEIENEASKEIAQFLLVARGDGDDPAGRRPPCAQPTEL